MLPIERRNEILSRLMLDGRVIVSDLSELYNVTEETIRRDLDKLEKDGLAKKTYGGAVKNDSLNIDLPYTIRKQTNVEGKKYIAEIIGTLIEDGENILLDSSTTALYTMKSIYNRSNITIITNSVEMLMDAPLKNDWKFISTGGNFSQTSLSLTGGRAEDVISSYNADKAVISCKGIDMSKGLTDTNDGNANVKKSFISSAKTVIVGVDGTKFDKVSFVRFSDFNDVDIVVTDKDPGDEWKNYFEKKNIKLYY